MQKETVLKKSHWQRYRQLSQLATYLKFSFQPGEQVGPLSEC